MTSEEKEEFEELKNDVQNLKLDRASTIHAMQEQDKQIDYLLKIIEQQGIQISAVRDMVTLVDDRQRSIIQAYKDNC